MKRQRYYVWIVTERESFHLVRSYARREAERLAQLFADLLGGEAVALPVGDHPAGDQVAA